MPRSLMILEVSQKQAYIFGSKLLKQNLRRSNEIRVVTEPAFFEHAAPELFNAERNMVYTGGGHTVLQFDTREQATAFARAVTAAALRYFPQIEMFVKTLPYDDALTPGQNLLELSKALESKKSRRAASFHTRSFGQEDPARPEAPVQEPWLDKLLEHTPPAPDGWVTTRLTDDIAAYEADAGSEQGGYIGVVHIDGNSMGSRVNRVYQSADGADWETCTAALRKFSESIDDDFAAAYDETQQQLADYLAKHEQESLRLDGSGRPILPLRKVIGAGDDVCFIAAGRFAIETAVAFLHALAKRINAQDGQGYAACAGVVLIHKNDPFRAAYDLSEELCSSAKKFGASLDENGRLSVIDWHIEYGQPGEGLGAIREGYRTLDGARLELRPLIVSVPQGVPCQADENRSYRYFLRMLRAMQTAEKGLPRSKMKELRTSLREGKIETELAVRKMRLTSMTKAAGGSVFGEAKAADGTSEVRCLCFDAIELMDHMTPWREEDNV